MSPHPDALPLRFNYDLQSNSNISTHIHTHFFTHHLSPARSLSLSLSLSLSVTHTNTHTHACPNSPCSACSCQLPVSRGSFILKELYLTALIFFCEVVQFVLFPVSPHTDISNVLTSFRTCLNWFKWL
ncbi:hypothetical protein XENORESO_014998 [Xenotaenia resolanae]|uniref:Uncharacterized protein n=1 Tax=Xenotaenia resolanae TaxID=208358 RepID=A0ABV0WYN3_9TELE